ncbi:MAG: hypothetical protein ACKOWN_04950 [Microbacteriaceae bacterium]
MSHHHNPFNDDEEPTTNDLWELVSNGTGTARTDAMITLAQRFYHESKYGDAASMQERLADVFIEEESPDDAVVAFARATNAWTEAEEWDSIEAVAERVKSLEDKAFSGDAWRDYYQAYAWSAYLRRASVVALEFVERALSHTSEFSSLHIRASLQWQKGTIVATFGRTREALAILEGALLDARESNSIPLVIDILSEMAQLEVQLLNANRALALTEEARTLMTDSFVWPALRQQVEYARGCALLAAGHVAEAVPILEQLVEMQPPYAKIRTMIRLAECGHEKSESWESRAYVLARNTNTWDLLNHLEINRAMRTDAMLAIPVLDTVISRAVEYDDDDSRDAARLVLARKYLELGDFPAAMGVLEKISAVNFGDDMVKVITYFVLRAETLLELGDLVEARSIATTLTRLDSRREFLAGIAEGFWQLALIEFATNGSTREWEHLAHSSIAHLARAEEFELLSARAQLLQMAPVDDVNPFSKSIDTVEDLIADIRDEQDPFATAAA